jgi:hypothetical protein
MTNSNSKFAEPTHFEPFNNYYIWLNCWKSAIYNLFTAPEHLPTPESRRKMIVAGSFSTVDDWHIWGGEGKIDPSYFLEDWCACHVWIEDEDGRIWDHLSDNLNVCIQKYERTKNVKSKVITIPMGGIEINGMTNAEIEAAYGFSYHPAPAECQKFILENAYCKWLPIRYYNYWTGSVFVEGWVGMGYKCDNMKEQIKKNNMFYNLRKLPQACLGEKQHQLWWRDFYSQPLDKSKYDYYFMEMGNETLTRYKTAEENAEAFEWIETGIAPPTLGKWMDEVIDKRNNTSNTGDLDEFFAALTGDLATGRIPEAGETFTFGNFTANVVSSRKA